MKMFSIAPMRNLLTYPFKDPKAGSKMLVGSLLIFANFIIPIIPGFFVYGYAARIARRISHDDGELVLPEWNDWGSLFSDGFKILMASLIYTLPAFLIIAAGSISYFIASFGMAFESASGNDPTMFFIVYFISLFIFMLSLVLSIGILMIEALFAPGALMHLIHEKRFGAAFQIGHWWPIYRRNFAGFIFTFIIAMGLSQILMLTIYLIAYSIILSFLVPFLASFASFYMILVMFPLFAQAYREGLPQSELHPIEE